jgi:spore coat protein A, manganese oxidase
MLSRRQALQTGVMAGALYALPSIRFAYAFAQTPPIIPLFDTDLRGIGTIGVAKADPKPAPVTGVLHYTLNIDQFQDDGVAPTLGKTTLRGYSPTKLLAGQAHRHLGGIIVAHKDQPIQITFRNNLPAGKHIIPNDLTIPEADQGNNRTAVHLHGGFTPWISDGVPFAWWDPTGRHGVSFLNNKVLNPRAAANEAEYYYTNSQSARFCWYHDHAMGITRINAYAGIASALLIRDKFEANLIPKGLPNLLENGGHEIPLIFQDKVFVGADINVQDLTWSSSVSPLATTPGSLWYAHVYDPDRWQLNPGTPPPDPSVIPEFFGDTMLVNGTAFPAAVVEPRRYRLRLLNACNARFLNLQFYIADSSPNGITLDANGVPTNTGAMIDPTTPGKSILQIGTEGGFLPKPVRIPTNVPFNATLPLQSSLVVAPAERPDILVDFRLHPGQSIILYNDAPAPFPSGDPINDYFPGFDNGNPVNATTPAGFGPNSRILMRFEVGATLSAPADPPLQITTTTDLRQGIDPPLIPFGSSKVPTGVFARQLTLNETFDSFGRLIQLLGTRVPPGPIAAGFGRTYESPVTEQVMANDVEVWEIYNLTADVHPMHFHLVNVQLINRQPFQQPLPPDKPRRGRSADMAMQMQQGVTFTGPATPAEPNETGWKEVVMMFPGTVTRIIQRFALPKIVTAYGDVIPTPPSPRTGGDEYVWHCHILEHEEHDMMRPLVVFKNR